MGTRKESDIPIPGMRSWFELSRMQGKEISLTADNQPICNAAWLFYAAMVILEPNPTALVSGYNVLVLRLSFLRNRLLVYLQHGAATAAPRA